MTHFPYLLFHQSPEQLRRIGSRGGKAQARNRRQRRLTLTEPHLVPIPPPLLQTTAEAIAMLDAQYPWLCGAEKRNLGY